MIIDKIVNNSDGGIDILSKIMTYHFKNKKIKCNRKIIHIPSNINEYDIPSNMLFTLSLFFNLNNNINIYKLTKPELSAILKSKISTLKNILPKELCFKYNDAYTLYHKSIIV